MKIFSFLLALVIIFNYSPSVAQLPPVGNSGTQLKSGQKSIPIIPGAERMEIYLPLLKGKSVAVFANQTSLVKNSHLVDTLLKCGIKVVKIFGPEHGFRGEADAGEKLGNTNDKKTGIPVISLYGNHKKPTAEDLLGVDMLIFDIQDVGVRFYTFISSLEYYLEASLENHIPLLILDRPNPNGFYVDGPVLDKKFKSFVGMQPIPVVYGMTVGEYALMLAGEKWLSTLANAAYINQPASKDRQKRILQLKIIPCKNYDHNSKYVLPVAPSPNLKSMQAIYLYPSTCFFEGTLLSEGRGTEAPFQIFGHPSLPNNLYSFIPKPTAGAKNSKCFYQKCYGWYKAGSNEAVLQDLNNTIQIKYMLDAYQLFPGKDSFFLKNNFFNQLAGTDLLMAQIKQEVNENDIRKSWKPLVDSFKKIRKKYLLYKDFATN
ncbi:MAG: DUF1343 domain-containing protein [Chitinophagia bacterium]|nr:DUF1343 domain-containing protein [Chitinophagia bacterium]